VQQYNSHRETSFEEGLFLIFVRGKVPTKTTSSFSGYSCPAPMTTLWIFGGPKMAMENTNPTEYFLGFFGLLRHLGPHDGLFVGYFQSLSGSTRLKSPPDVDDTAKPDT
jgi:hypothetical protein